MDPDCHQLRNDGKGLFSHYNQIIKNRESPPTFMSTGYKAGTGSTPLLELTIRLDQNARAAMFSYNPLAPYLPEPNLMIQVDPKSATIQETFIKKGKSAGLESRIIVGNVLKDRLLEPAQAIAFQTLGAIPTTIPERFYSETNRSTAPITKDSFVKKAILQAIRSRKCQSHIFPLKGFAANLAKALSTKDTFELRGSLANILGTLDPIALFPIITEIFPIAKRNFSLTMSIYLHYNLTFTSIINSILESNHTVFNDTIARSVQSQLDQQAIELRRLLPHPHDQQLANFQKVTWSSLTTLLYDYEKLKEYGLTPEETIRVLCTAAAVSVSTYSILEEYL